MTRWDIYNIFGKFLLLILEIKKKNRSKDKSDNKNDTKYEQESIKTKTISPLAILHISIPINYILDSTLLNINIAIKHLIRYRQVSKKFKLNRSKN